MKQLKQAAMQGHGHIDEQGGKQAQQREQEQEQQQQSQIHDDWSKIETAISSLSNKTLNDCVKRLNESLFNKLYKCTKVEEKKDDISIETLDKIMSEIDDDVKTQYIAIDTKNENKKNEKSHYVEKEMRQFISEPVMLHICFYVPFFNIFVVVVDCTCCCLFVYVLICSLLN